MNPRIPIAAPMVGQQAERLVLEVLRSGRLTQGDMVRRFEALCAEMADVGYAVAVFNGTVSLEASLEVLGIGPGDEVVTSAFTFGATLNAILRSGASARFADVGDDLNLDPASAESLLGPKTAAMLPVHLYGLMADMERVSEIALRHDLAILEDAAQAHGAEQRGRRAGSFGLGSFSFYATKNVSAGEGGVVTTRDETLAEKVRLLRNQGMIRRYGYEVVGRNLRMTELQAALAVAGLENLERSNRRRARNAAWLSDRLAAHPDLRLPHAPEGRSHVWHQFTVLLPPDVDRDAIMRSMDASGVEARAYYPRVVWDHPVFRDHPRVHLDDAPRAMEVASRCLSLPVHPSLTEDEVDRVANTLLHALSSGVRDT